MHQGISRVILPTIGALLMLAFFGFFTAQRFHVFSEQPLGSDADVSTTANATALDLSNKGLTATPSWVFDRTSLETLDLSGNDLAGALPSQIGHLINLRTLNASHNRMTGVPAEIGQLQHLEYLDLSYNQLTGLPHELGNLQQLRILNLTGNPGVSSLDLAYIRTHAPKTTEIILQ